MTTDKLFDDSFLELFGKSGSYSSDFIHGAKVMFLAGQQSAAKECLRIGTEKKEKWSHTIYGSEHSAIKDVMDTISSKFGVNACADGPEDIMRHPTEHHC